MAELEGPPFAQRDSSQCGPMASAGADEVEITSLGILSENG